MATSASQVYQHPPKAPVPCVDLPPIPGANNPGVPTVPVCSPPPVDNAGTLPLTGWEALPLLCAAVAAGVVGFAFRRLSRNRS